MIDLKDAFSKLRILESEEFDLLDQDSKEEMSNFLADDESENEADIDVIDPEVEDEADLEDSYIGKIIIKCPVCKSPMFKSEEEWTEMKDEEQTCPFCNSVDMFTAVGKVVPIEIEPEESDEADDADDDVKVSIEDKADELKEALRRRRIRRLRESKRNKARGKRSLKEDLESVSIETDDQIINISSSEKECCEDEAEAPETAEIIAPLDFEGEESEESPAEDEVDEVDEVDEESFDEMAESLLRENYKNIVSYKTTKAKDCGNHIVMEGIVTLKGGKKRLTEFRIRPSKFSRNGKGACLVENLQLGKKKIVRARVVESKRINEGIFGKKKESKGTLDGQKFLRGFVDKVNKDCGLSGSYCLWFQREDANNWQSNGSINIYLSKPFVGDDWSDVFNTFRFEDFSKGYTNGAYKNLQQFIDSKAKLYEKDVQRKMKSKRE